MSVLSNEELATRFRNSQKYSRFAVSVASLLFLKSASRQNYFFAPKLKSREEFAVEGTHTPGGCLAENIPQSAEALESDEPFAARLSSRLGALIPRGARLQKAFRLSIFFFFVVKWELRPKGGNDGFLRTVGFKYRIKFIIFLRSEEPRRQY